MNRPRVVITGGSGLLALNWACAMRDRWDVVLGTHQHSVRLTHTSSCQLDLDSPAQLARQFAELAPDLVVHTAGLTNVDRCEEDSQLACQVNAGIARNVARAAAIRDVRLIHVSTDQLYAGDRSYYSESDPPKPLNEYGRTKALAEEWVLEANPNSLIVRTNFFCWGHASRQSFTDWLIYSFRGGNALTLFDDVHFTPILADTLALASHELVEKGVSGIVNIVGDQRLSKYEFALLLCKEFGLSPALILPSQLAHAHQAARRPLDMSLDNGRACRLLGRRLGGVSEYLHTLRTQESAGRRAELLGAVY